MSSSARLRTLYVATDLVMSFVGMLLFTVIRYYATPQVYLTTALSDWLVNYPMVLAGLIVYPLVNVALAAVSGYYNDVVAKSRLGDIKNSLGIGLLTTLGVYFVSMINDYMPQRTQNYELLLVLWLCMSLFPYAGRTVINIFRRKALRKLPGIYRTVIVGTPAQAAQMVRRLTPRSKKTMSWYNIVGEVDPLQGNDKVLSVIDRLRPSVIIITPHPDGVQATTSLINVLYPTECDLCLSPDLYQLITSRTRITDIADEPLINVTNANLPAATMNLKRLGDIFVSAVALVALSPVYAAIALGIKLDSPGPVLYRQQRIGYHKRPFDIIKFRTMQSDAEAAGPALSHEDDPRITRAGRFLRKYRLDELPQFWNVLRGEMSIVGPRPEREFFIRQIVSRVPQYSLIHQVRPGITSWGMVKYGYASNVDEMIERLPYDLLYIENISLGVDLKIMFHTVNTVLTGKGL